MKEMEKDLMEVLKAMDNFMAKHPGKVLRFSSFDDTVTFFQKGGRYFLSERGAEVSNW